MQRFRVEQSFGEPQGIGIAQCALTLIQCAAATSGPDPAFPRVGPNVSGAGADPGLGAQASTESRVYRRSAFVLEAFARRDLLLAKISSALEFGLKSLFVQDVKELSYR